jgi:hypothetical protein
MASERVTTRDDGTTSERVVERDVDHGGGGPIYVDRGGGIGVGAVIVGITVLALVAMVAIFLLNANRHDALRTNAVTSAASSVANSADSAAKDVGPAAGNAANPVGAAADNAAPAPPR